MSSHGIEEARLLGAAAEPYPSRGRAPRSPLVIRGSAVLAAAATGPWLVLGAQRAVSGDLVAFGFLAVFGVLVVGVLARAGASARVEREARLAADRSESRLRALLAQAAGGIAVLDAEGRLTYVSPAVEAILGVPAGDVEGVAAKLLVHPSDRRAMVHAYTDALGHPGGVRRAEVRLKNASGDWRWLEVLFSNRLADPAVAGVVVNFHDVTGRKEAEQLLSHQALHDPLTGLPNRLLLLDRLGQALSRARRRGTTVAVLFCDLDRFKVVNDSLGHEVGDRLLVDVAARLSATLRGNDSVSRLGGDEFVVVCDDLPTPDEARLVAERLLAAFTEPFDLAGRELFITPSVGIACSAGHLEPEALLRDADLAMYRAKEEGRGRAEVFDEELHAGTVRRMELEHGLRRALERDELTVLYQPLVDLRSGRIQSLEALVRWAHPTRGLVPPSEFVALAEDTGVIVDIGARVLDLALGQLRRWRDAGVAAPGLQVGVNLSARQLRQEDLPDLVAATLSRHRLEPAALCLEVTESVLVERQGTIEALQRLRALGVTLAIDDFGTGYSSLAYLKRLPVHALKIDRAFVSGLAPVHGDAADAAIVEAVLRLASALDLHVVAEGVEHDEQVSELLALGCSSAQGYRFSPPAAADEVAVMLSRGGFPEAALDGAPQVTRVRRPAGAGAGGAPVIRLDGAVAAAGGGGSIDLTDPGFSDRATDG